MGILRPVDNYVAELISALRKAFEVAHNMTQTEALRQKQRYDRKASTVTLNKGDVVCREEETKGLGVMRYTLCAIKSTWTC